MTGGGPIFSAAALLLATATGTASAVSLAAATVPPAAPATATVSPAPTPAPRTIVGSVVSVDRARGEVVISETVTPSRQAKHRAETVTLRLDASTQLTRGKSPVSLQEVAAGDQAVARYLGPASGARALSLRLADPVRTPAAPTRPPS